MKYYDIELNFYDYPVQCYEWSKEDNIERFCNIEVIKLYDISDLILYECSLNLDDGRYIVSDSVNSIGIEVIDNKIIYYSCLKYDDDNYICDLVKGIEYKDINIIKGKRKVLNNMLRSDVLIKNVLSNVILNSDDNFIKYVYYDRFHKLSKNTSKCRDILLKDLNSNINDYYSLYEMIVNK